MTAGLVEAATIQAMVYTILNSGSTPLFFTPKCCNGGSQIMNFREKKWESEEKNYELPHKSLTGTTGHRKVCDSIHRTEENNWTLFSCDMLGEHI